MSQTIEAVGVLNVVDQGTVAELDPSFDQVDDLTLAEAMLSQATPHLFGELWQHPHAAPVAARSRKMAEAA